MINQNQKNFQAANNQMIQVCLVISPAKEIYRTFNKPNKMIYYHKIVSQFHNIYFINKRMVSRMIRLDSQETFCHLVQHKNNSMISNLLIRMMIGTIVDNTLNKIKILFKHTQFFSIIIFDEKFLIVWNHLE